MDARLLLGSAGFSSNSTIFSAFFCIHDTKTACFFHRNLDNGDGCICMMFFVVIKHLIVVHLVNMVTRKNQQIFRCIGINKVNVLRNSIRSSSVYVQVCICFFPWWQNIYAAVFGIQTPSSSCGCELFSRTDSYWVSTPTTSIPLFAQLLSGKSMIRYFPPYDTAGLATFLSGHEVCFLFLQPGS